MMQVSTSLKTEEDENELSLELSIGRKCYDKNSTTMLPRKSSDFAICPKSQLDDLVFKPDIHALRRQEARKKRDQKLRFKSTLGGGGGGDRNGNACCVMNHEDHGILDDEEEEEEMPPRKKEKCLGLSGDNNITHNNVVSNCGPRKQEKLLVNDFKLKMNREPGLMGESPCPYPMQYVPFTNGFVYHPHGVMPSVVDKDKRVGFASAAGGNECLDKDRRVSFDVAACRSFRPYDTCRNLEMSVVNGKSDASSGGSSPAVSDHHNSALQGGSSSISFQQESRNVFGAGNGPKRSEIKSWNAMGMCSNEVKVRTKANHIVNTTLLGNIQVRELRCNEEPKPAATLEDPTLSTKNPIDPALLKKNISNAVITKPLKTQSECNSASPLPQMPCVSTTGNGPNGKTITGFLYRYTKTEVCIVCVCHGTSFSPAEFVKHAGGVDVEHPLRHITIVPSDLT
ncbi:hypothetical protein DCAR_0100287 [Daucus carota subsp. sativus]|uniref:Ninja-family protein n=1 Tax=Daucus carota subsp. sativus TaxID=79200 RepID=A0A166FJM0_DAUCS|nr:PREDICTED: uncharacterized protein LOC108215785 [Daucus carota subsp. sativus]WOG81142.1 hypothetical protein DCAR_0100287 [Daucus carota subsp. sativus]